MDNTKESVYFVVLIGCAIIAVISFAPIGLVALFLSVVVSASEPAQCMYV